jgi:hypothetical protein
MYAPTYLELRLWALENGYTPSTLAPYVESDNPQKTAVRILFHLHGSRWDDEPIPYPKLCQLYHGEEPASSSLDSERSIRMRVIREARYVGEYGQDEIDNAPCITFQQFRRLVKQRGWSERWLIEQVKPYLDEPRETVHRILYGAHVPAHECSEQDGRVVEAHHEPMDEVAIPYTCLIDLYHQATQPGPLPDGQRSCGCGCGQRVRGRQRYATPGCRQRAYRQRSLAHR